MLFGFKQYTMVDRKLFTNNTECTLRSIFTLYKQNVFPIIWLKKSFLQSHIT